MSEFSVHVRTMIWASRPLTTWPWRVSAWQQQSRFIHLQRLASDCKSDGATALPRSVRNNLWGIFPNNKIASGVAPRFGLLHWLPAFSHHPLCQPSSNTTPASTCLCATKTWTAESTPSPTCRAENKKQNLDGLKIIRSQKKNVQHSKIQREN